MSVPRFYCPSLLHATAQLELPPSAAHHARTVLRLRVNDAVQLFDGTGIELRGIISSINKNSVVLGDLRPCQINRESALSVVLAQAMCSSEKMDWVVQKATELGVAEIQPVQTQRSVASLSGERAEKRVDHWRNVAIAACEQCGRNILPQVHRPQNLQNWLGSQRIPSDTSSGRKFILLPEAANSLSQYPAIPGAITLLIGPEGGFTADEAGLAQQAGFLPLRLGSRVLRTETAALVGIAALQTLWGDFQ